MAKAIYYRDAGFEVRRLTQRYADQGTVGFVGWHRCGFEVRDSRAYITVKCASSCTSAVVELRGLEPLTPCLQSRCSSS
jgi:hypothetical protein